MEIKFRAWFKYAKRMCEVLQIDFINKRVFIEADKKGIPRNYLYFNDLELMPYSGLNDKNGNEIYKDDILDGSYINPMNNEKVKMIYVVDFENGNYYARLIGKSPYGDSLLYFKNQHCEVIGNKWSNPELLEVQND